MQFNKKGRKEGVVSQVEHNEKEKNAAKNKHYSYRSMDQSTHNDTLSFKHIVPEACLIPANRRTSSSGVLLFTVEL